MTVIAEATFDVLGSGRTTTEALNAARDKLGLYLGADPRAWLEERQVYVVDEEHGVVLCRCTYTAEEGVL